MNRYFFLSLLTVVGCASSSGNKQTEMTPETPPIPPIAATSTPLDTSPRPISSSQKKATPEVWFPLTSASVTTHRYSTVALLEVISDVCQRMEDQLLYSDPSDQTLQKFLELHHHTLLELRTKAREMDARNKTISDLRNQVKTLLESNDETSAKIEEISGCVKKISLLRQELDKYASHQYSSEAEDATDLYGRHYHLQRLD